MNIKPAILKMNLGIHPIQHAFRITAACALCFSSIETNAADDSSGAADAEMIEQELKIFSDPTIMRRRAWLETEWNSFKDDSEEIEETLGGLWAWSLSENHDLGVRVKLPYRLHIAGDQPRDSDEEGLGDIKAAVGSAWRLRKDLRIAGGVELGMPTAEDRLGDGDWRLQEFGSVAWDVTPWLTLSPSAEYNHTIAEKYETSDRNYLELFFPATLVLPHRWSMTPQYELKADFHHNDEVTHSGKFLIAKRLSCAPIVLAASIKKPFDGGQKEFQFNFIASYFFE